MVKRLYISIGLLSASIIAFQLALMQMLSISQWSHFAYMVISVALLGFGASGTILTFTKKWLTKHIDLSLPVFVLLTSLCMALLMQFASNIFGGFDSYLLFLDGSHIYGLTISYMALFIPFFSGAMAIGLVYFHYVNRVGPLYFADLFGSGLGGLLMLLLFWHFRPADLPYIIALLPLAGGVLLIRKQNLRRLLPLALAVVAANVYGLLMHLDLPMSQYKSLSRSMLLPDAEILETKTSPYGEIKLFSSTSLRYAPGLSLTYTGQVPVRQAIFNNGNWFGPLIDFELDDSDHFLDYATNALPFEISIPRRVLIPDAGTALFAAHALSRGAQYVTAIEPNAAATDLMKKHIYIPTDRLKIQNQHPRSYLMADTNRYDLIILPVIEAFGGSSGINALSEQYLFTKEAFAEMWDRLSSEGMIAVTVWMDFPARNSLKMLATLVETLEAKTNADPTTHLAAIRSWGTLTFVLKKTPLTASEIARIRSFCHMRNFDPLLLPGITHSERTQFNQLQDETFFALVNQILSIERESLYDAYDFQLRPATDKKPYFSQFLRLDRLGKMREVFGQGAVPFLEVGYLIVLLTFLQISIAAIVFIIVPLLAFGFKGGGKAFTLLHFSGIGVGFMFVEMMLIQQFTLYFGHPIYAAAAVLSGMLIFSGTGALVSQRLTRDKKWLLALLSAIIILILVLAVSLTPMLRSTISASMAVKVLVSMLIIGPLSFLMGVPFPAGLRLLAGINKNLIPWAWGINGCFSVISTALATIIAVEAGYSYVMLIAAAFYMLTLLINLQLKWKQ
jgi:spermidine synthase